MNTEALIRELAADAARPTLGLRTLMTVALVAGSSVSLLLFALLFDLRVDFAAAIQGHAFRLKLALVACLTVTASSLLTSAARPLPRRNAARLGLAPLLLSLAVIFELASAPLETWLPHALGRNALHCLLSIPLLSLPAAFCLFAALRRGAPATASSAGALAGLSAGGVGACLYALTCPDDNPLFVALWYPLGIGIVTALGSLAGRRWLRW